MATDFTSIPTMPYDTFLAKVSGIKLTDPSKPMYTSRHKLMSLGSNFIWVYDENGVVCFERLGANLVGDMFRLIEKQFNVKLMSCYGLHWAEDNT